MILHRHRIKPGREGGKYEKGNIIICPPHIHAWLHKIRYAKYGDENDRIAFEALSGWTTSTEARVAAAAEAKRGVPRSEETKYKLSKALKGRPTGRSPMKGRKQSEKHMNTVKGNEHACRKTWKVTHPNNKISIVTNMAKFARENGLNHHSKLISVANGHRKHYCGYKVEIYDEK